MSSSERIAQEVSETVIASCKSSDYAAVLAAVIKRLQEDLKDFQKEGLEDDNEDEDFEKE